MKKWTEKELVEAGYKIENACITSVDLSMADHGCMCLSLVLEGEGWGTVYGGYILGKGYVGAGDEFIEGTAAGMESIIRIMDTMECERFNDLKDKYIRVATKGWGSHVNIIGNIIKDKWFDQESFFADKKETT